jgi:hypothetical protein
VSSACTALAAAGPEQSAATNRAARMRNPPVVTTKLWPALCKIAGIAFGLALVPKPHGLADVASPVVGFERLQIASDPSRLQHSLYYLDAAYRIFR